MTDTAAEFSEEIVFPYEGFDPSTKVVAKNKGELSDIDELTNEVLVPSNQLSWDLLDLVQSLPETNYDKFYGSLLQTPETISRTSYRFNRVGIEGKINSYKEDFRLASIADASTSTSINRRYGPRADALKGKSTFLPFKPGGISLITSLPKEETLILNRNEYGLYDTPPGLSRGLSIQTKVEEMNDVTALEKLVSNDSPYDDDDNNNEIKETNVEVEGEIEGSELPFDAEDLNDIVSMDFQNMKAALTKSAQHKTVWAHVVDLNHQLENFNEVVPNMARTWPFELDNFQKEAIYHLEQGDSVFVAAHTSAGKTVVAEYAIAMAARNMTKCIYTSPIKALSNQKFRDFKETFKEVDVGLITGDVQINSEANCLIMTTEILRSMLYRGADLIRDVEFVIFDEVHYVNDIDRGVVWEEVIIMLPDHVKFILLSATVPNTFEFANWVGRTKKKDMYVISTPKRPVPLEIFIWAKKDLYKAIDAKRQFSESEFKKHKDVYETQKKATPQVHMGNGSRGGPGGSARGGNRAGARGGRGDSGAGSRGGRGGGSGSSNRGNMLNKPGGWMVRDAPNKNTWNELIQYLKKKELLPAVIFVFSKKRCEEYANTLGGLDLCTAREKSEIHMFMNKAVSRLKKEDRELPQILKIREMLSRGIAVHHGGLLPIVKECIEIMFSRNLVKVLFATETFAMGLNLPTRTVVFNELRKHDGRGFRNLLPGEFTQMSGRAGRRGLDSTGTVIVMSYNKPLSISDFKEVTLGTPTKLLSQFRLTYNMILNLLRIEALRVEEMIKHSFSENSTQTLLPEHQLKIKDLDSQLKLTEIEDCSICGLINVDDAHNLVHEYERTYSTLMDLMMDLHVIRYSTMIPGRLLCYRDEYGCARVGFHIKLQVRAKKLHVLTFSHGSKFEESSSKFKLPYIPLKPILRYFSDISFEGKLKVDTIECTQVTFLGRYSLKADLTKVLRNDAEEVSKTNEQIKLLLKFVKKWEELKLSKAKLALHDEIVKKDDILSKLNELDICPRFNEHYSILHTRTLINDEIQMLLRLVSDDNLELLPDYEQRLAVLQSLEFIDAKHNVLLKGRVACEINSGWELIMTELVLDNFLGDFEPEEIVALLSCFVYEGRTNDEEDIPMTPRLEKGKKRILEITEKILKEYSAKRVILTSEEEDFMQRKRFALVNVVYEWARGLTFNEIMERSLEAEGTIVRVITRLDEICREVKNAALIVGDSTLHAKMSEAQERIKRDIVFCASLYL